MRLTDLAAYLRRQGLTVMEHGSWEARGVEFPAEPNTIIAHHTATSARASGDLPTLRLLIDGRSDLPGPLCQLALSRSGVVHVIAGGKANHAGAGAWKGVTSSSRTIGIEAEHPGGDALWPTGQYAAYVALCAALCRYLEVGPDRVCAHREWALPAGRKVDVTFDMNTFRSKVAARLAPAKEGPHMLIVKNPAGNDQWLTAMGKKWRIGSVAELAAYEKVCPRVVLDATAFARLTNAS